MAKSQKNKIFLDAILSQIKSEYPDLFDSNGLKPEYQYPKKSYQKSYTRRDDSGDNNRTQCEDSTALNDGIDLASYADCDDWFTQTYFGNDYGGTWINPEDGSEAPAGVEGCCYNEEGIDLTYTPGDLNNDGIANVVDIVTLVNYILGSTPADIPMYIPPYSEPGGDTVEPITVGCNTEFDDYDRPYCNYNCEYENLWAPPEVSAFFTPQCDNQDDITLGVESFCSIEPTYPVCMYWNVDGEYDPESPSERGAPNSSWAGFGWFVDNTYMNTGPFNCDCQCIANEEGSPYHEEIWLDEWGMDCEYNCGLKADGEEPRIIDCLGDCVPLSDWINYQTQSICNAQFACQSATQVSNDEFIFDCGLGRCRDDCDVCNPCGDGTVDSDCGSWNTGCDGDCAGVIGGAALPDDFPATTGLDLSTEDIPMSAGNGGGCCLQATNEQSETRINYYADTDGDGLGYGTSYFMCSNNPNISTYSLVTNTLDTCPGTSDVPDCLGVCGGNAIHDCGGTCYDPDTDDPTNVPDCDDVCGGDAVVDICGVCGGDGIPEGYCDCDGNVADCAGECGGSAELDECGICGGSGIPDNVCDCDGNIDLGCGCGIDGPNPCGICGDGTVIEEEEEEVEDGTVTLHYVLGMGNSSTISKITPLTGNLYNYIFEMSEDNLFMNPTDIYGNLFDPTPGDGNVYTISTLQDSYLKFTIDSTHSADYPPDSRRWWITPTEAYMSPTETGTSQSGDNQLTTGEPILLTYIPFGTSLREEDEGGDCVQGCDGNWGIDGLDDIAELDECGVCNGDGIAEGECNCAGDVLDSCGICGGDDTPDTGTCDCEGTPNGTEVYDECGVCGGDGPAEGTCDCDGSVLDECGVCNGSGIAEGACDCAGNSLDDCGVCQGDNSTCTDCNDDVNGGKIEYTCGYGDASSYPCGGGPHCSAAVTDNCSTIPAGDCDCNENVDLGCGCGLEGPSGCDVQCNSTLENDECGVCGGDNSSCWDCNDVPNGTAVPDCNGDCCCPDSGTDVIDGLDALCSDSTIACSVPDCEGTCNGNIVQDCNGDCGGTAIFDCQADPVCCGGETGLTCFIDDCAGVCYDSTGSPANIEDCAGECGGDAKLDCNDACNGSAYTDCDSNCCCPDSGTADISGQDALCSDSTTACAQHDCNGVCGGDATLDTYCNVCGGIINSIADCINNPGVECCPIDLDMTLSQFPSIYLQGGVENLIGCYLPPCEGDICENTPGGGYNIGQILNNSLYAVNPDLEGNEEVLPQEALWSDGDTVYIRLCEDEADPAEGECDNEIRGFLIRIPGYGDYNWYGTGLELVPGMGLRILTQNPGWFRFTLPTPEE